MGSLTLWVGLEQPRADWHKANTTKIPGYLYGWGLLNPNWHHIQNALNNMNGSTLNEVVLIDPDKGSLMAGGGDKGRYIVVYFPRITLGVGSQTLVDPFVKKDQDTIILTVQTPSEYPAKFGVQLPLVMEVFKYFFDTGEILKQVVWECE